MPKAASAQDTFEADSQLLQELRGWSPAALQLARLLALAPQPEIRRDLRAICHRTPPLLDQEVAAALRPLALEVAQSAAATFAGALGTTPEAVLQFAHPANPATALEGERGVVRRLDRIWGGMPLLLLEARREVLLRWPGPGSSPMIAAQGALQVNGEKLQAFQRVWVLTGEEVQIPAGTQLMLRPALLGRLLEAARALGIEMPDSQTRPAAIRVGRSCLVLTPERVTVNGRQLRLTATEYQLLQLLSREPGVVVRRQELAAELGRAPRALDRLLLGLRNKLGDGLISTAYGVGYRLEAD